LQKSESQVEAGKGVQDRALALELELGEQRKRVDELSSEVTRLKEEAESVSVHSAPPQPPTPESTKSLPPVVPTNKQKGASRSNAKDKPVLDSAKRCAASPRRERPTTAMSPLRTRFPLFGGRRKGNSVDDTQAPPSK
jgi:hypothetical protein